LAKRLTKPHEGDNLGSGMACAPPGSLSEGREFMTTVVKVGEAKTHLSDLLARVEAGEEITIARGDVSIARLTRIEKPNDSQRS
jgi:Antitoxin Phd_YefM, type II toxin-antitoxin system